MSKLKAVILKKWNPKSVLGGIVAVWVVYFILSTIIFGSGTLSHFLRVFGIMLMAGVWFQTAGKLKRKETISFLDILQYGENSMVDIWNTGRLWFLQLRRFRQPILLLIFIYAAHAGLAKWALERWGGSLSTAMQHDIMHTVQIVYSASSRIAFMAVFISVLWVFLKISIRNHLTGDGDEVDSIIERLEEEGIDVSYCHSPDGHCLLDTKKLLDILVNDKENSASKSALYWDIKKSLVLLQRVQFFPLGKPKTPVQQLSEYLHDEQLLKCD